MWTQAAMVRRLNWEKANLDRKPRRSLADEQEFMEKDSASRWLTWKDQQLYEQRAAAKRRSRHRSKRQSRKAQSARSPNVHATTDERPPWEE